jgi:hypothetical protein
MDVIDETEELCYIDDDAPSGAKEQESSLLETRDGQKKSAMGPRESSGLKPQDPIDLDPPEIERPTGDEFRSPPPVSDDTSRDVVINDVTLTSLKTQEWSQLVFCDDFVLVTMVASHLFIGDEIGFSVMMCLQSVTNFVSSWI